ncbi:MAG: hypothetical protein ACK480_16670 [Planctomycetota bacterium]
MPAETDFESVATNTRWRYPKGWNAKSVFSGIHFLAQRTETTSFMSDHWNLLADLLGTPNYAPRSKKATKSDSAAKTNSDLVAPPAEATTAPSDFPPESDTQPKESLSPPPSAEQPREKSMLQSSWDALASLFGVASEQPRQETEPQQSAPQTPAADSLQKSSRTRKPAETKPEPIGNSKAKRPQTKSMWDVATDDPQAKQEDQQVAEDSSSSGLTSTFGEPNSKRQAISARRETEDQVEADRRGPRRSPRRGRDQMPSENPEEQVQSQRPPRESRSNRDRSNEQPRDDRRRDNLRSELRNSDTPRDDSKRENRRDDDRNQRRQRIDKETPANIAPKELSKRTSGSGFAAGLVSDNDSSEADDPIGFGTGSATDTDDTRSTERTRRKKRRGRKRDDHQPSENATSDRFDDSTDSEKDFDSIDRSSELADSRPRHGKIPSRTEIIGVVVEANVSNHQKHASSGRGRQRRPN